MATDLLCVPGPTGAGKTGAGIALAKALDGEVINFDSRQIYKDFPIITAQPSVEEQAQCPHLLYGFAGTDVNFGAAAFSELALQAIDDVRKRGKLPILVGGTGLYLNAILRPLAPIPDIPDDIRFGIREECERIGPNPLHERLTATDPRLAARLHPNDKQRIMRGLEVYAATGKPLSDWHAETAEARDFHVLKMGVGMELPDLTPFLYKRIEIMLEAGAVDEAREAMRINDNRKAPGWTGIGCAELYSYLKGEIDMEECKSLWGKNTRAYAKRQWTWFRSDKEIYWFEPGEHAAMIEEACRFFDA